MKRACGLVASTQGLWSEDRTSVKSLGLTGPQCLIWESGIIIFNLCISLGCCEV